MLVLAPRADSRFASIAPDAIGLIVQFLDFTVLARLCECSVELYMRLDPDAAPLVWRGVRPARRTQLLMRFARLSCANAQRMYAVYGDWLCSSAATGSSQLTVGAKCVTMPEWHFVYSDPHGPTGLRVHPDWFS
jgi:hypothetical protein